MKKPTLQSIYEDKVRAELQKKFGYGNPHEIPTIAKITVNSGLDASLDKGSIEDTVKDITSITGQKPIITKAKKSISNFKLRQGMPVGVKVTLRGARMWEFLYRLINVSLPNIRDFRGVSAKLDGQGNYSLGIADHTIFPEISLDGNKRTVGMDICITTSTFDDKVGRELLSLLGMPFRKAQSTITETNAPQAA
jgi:large subunit ribosomal protein L5